MDCLKVLVTPNEVRLNANHLKRVSDEVLVSVIADVHVIFIADYERRFRNKPTIQAKLKVIEKLLSQHMATLNVRRADSESVAGMSKAVNVPKDKDLEQTEYGQMAKKLAKEIPLDWGSDDKPASVVIY